MDTFEHIRLTISLLTKLNKGRRLSPHFSRTKKKKMTVSKISKYYQKQPDQSVFSKCYENANGKIFRVNLPFQYFFLITIKN